MPRKCSVPKCRSGYDKNERYSVFGLPRDPDLRTLWILAIRRAETGDLSFSSKHSGVCEKHFLKEDIIRSDVIVIEGKEVSLQRKIPKLAKHAVPYVFPNMPSCMIEVERATKPTIRNMTSIKPNMQREKCNAGSTTIDTSPANNQEVEEMARLRHENIAAQSDPPQPNFSLPNVCQAKKLVEQGDVRDASGTFGPGEPFPRLGIESLDQAEQISRSQHFFFPGMACTIQKLSEKMWRLNKENKALKQKLERVKGVPRCANGSKMLPISNRNETRPMSRMQPSPDIEGRWLDLPMTDSGLQIRARPYSKSKTSRAKKKFKVPNSMAWANLELSGIRDKIVMMKWEKTKHETMEDTSHSKRRKLQNELMCRLEGIECDAKAGCSRASFLLQQFENYDRKRGNWSESMMSLCARWHSQPRSSYCYVRRTEILVLPSAPNPRFKLLSKQQR